jgi:hypothetical protein
VDAHIEPITTTSNIAITQPIVTQTTSNSDSKASLDLKIEQLDIRLEPVDLKIEPLKVSTDSSIDLKPLAVDSCQTIRLAPLPPIHLRQPQSMHFGFTYMGMELFGFNVSSNSETFLNSPPKHFSPEPPMREEHHHDHREGERPRSGGLRVRVK